MIHEYHYPGEKYNFYVDASSGFGTRYDEYFKFCTASFGDFDSVWCADSYQWFYRFYFVSIDNATMFLLKFGFNHSDGSNG